MLSFAILSEYFPKEMSGRANAALNLLHVGGAFVLQSATGLIIEQWPEARGSYPAEAHQLAMGASIVLQLVAFAWFALPPRRVPVPAMARAASRSLSAAYARPRDSDDTLHNGRAGVDTACRACQQASRGLAIRRGRIGGALHRPGGSSFHDDQPSGSRCPYLRGRSLGRRSSQRRSLERCGSDRWPCRARAGSPRERSAMAIPGHHAIGIRAARADH